MRKGFTITLALLTLLILLVGCSAMNGYSQTDASARAPASTKAPESTQAPLFVFIGETSQGTPIVDGKQSGFKYSWPDMLESDDSDCFSEIGYCYDMEVLVLTFRSNGNTYLYLDVSESIWDEFRSASSQGGYFNSEIKSYYTCYRWN